ncbi:ras family-domain-containing protein [Chiua virens]|nr:ras family-domain-containing protein [Chiua virens]
MENIKQTRTPRQFLTGLTPSKDVLAKEFVGKHINELRTPAFVVDRAAFRDNCTKMHQSAKGWGANFRAHLKTHKTVEGTRLQLVSDAGETNAVIVSTLMEAWEVVKGGLVADGIVKDVLYGLPVGLNKLDDLSALHEEMSKYGGTVRIMVDNLEQVKFLEDYEKQQAKPKQWSGFIKLDGGRKRAGISAEPKSFKEFIKTVFMSTVVSVYGFYSHSGDAYGSTSLEEAESFLTGEVRLVNDVAAMALEVLAGLPPNMARNQPFVLSVGSTPTAHSASARAKVTSQLHGVLELHAGNYPMLDLQQLHTTLIDRPRISQRVLATVISYYPGRGRDGLDEAMCDAGAIAMSRDTGRIPGFGEIVGKSWRLGRISQEHGTLEQMPMDPSSVNGGADQTLKIGEIIQIVGQHACLIAAGHPWYYVVDSDADSSADKVVDIWVPWKGCCASTIPPCIMALDEYDVDATELLETYAKLLVPGEAGTGKSCLLHHFTHNAFKDHSQHTIGVEFSSRTVKLGEKKIKLQLWDTAGQERFRSVTRSYYRGAAGVILVYDITNRETFLNLSKWLADARTLASPHLVAVLVGNKSDREEDREVEWAEASRWAAENGVHFLESSSLSGDNVEAPFLLAARSILLSIESGVLDPEKAGSGLWEFEWDQKKANGQISTDELDVIRQVLLVATLPFRSIAG